MPSGCAVTGCSLKQNVMNNLKQKLKKCWKRGLLILLVCLGLEVFGFNHAYWQTRGNQPTEARLCFADGSAVEADRLYELNEAYLQNPLYLYAEIPAEEGLEVDYLCLNFGNVYMKENEYYRMSDVLNVQITVYDEGNADGYTLNERLISTIVPDTCYICLESSGRVTRLRLAITSEYVEAVSLQSLICNPQVPMHFSVWRVLFGFCLAMAVWQLFCGEKRTAMQTKADRCQWIATLALTLLAVFFLQWLTYQTVDYLGYDELAHSLADGVVYLEEEVDPGLLEAANPYDRTLMEQLGISTPYDTAYFNGHYYVYFGIMPCLLFYLPYYLLTGLDLSETAASMLVDLLTVTGSFFLMKALQKKYGPHLSQQMFLVLCLVMALAPSTILMLKRAAIYYIAIGTGIGLVCWGLYFWFSAKEDGRFHAGRGAFGSLLMGAAAACRPQLAMYSFFAFVLFADELKDIRHQGRKAAALLIPYIPVLALIFWYNQARFGSVLDFGAQYNLTGYDMVHIGTHFSRLIIGPWYYLFLPVTGNLEFPFLQCQQVSTAYAGFMANEAQLGGSFFLVPITLILLCPKVLKPCRQSRNLRIMGWVIVGAIVCADTVLCGVLMRYQMDFRLAFVLPAAVTFLEWQEQNPGQENLFMILCLVTLLFCGFTLFAQYESYDYNIINPVFYLRLRSFFDLWKL